MKTYTVEFRYVSSGRIDQHTVSTFNPIGAEEEVRLWAGKLVPPECIEIMAIYDETKAVPLAPEVVS